MARIEIFLFGQPHIEREGLLLPMARSRALALLAFLCRAKSSLSREVVIDLLWPTFSPQDARNNLRRELSILKSLLPDGLIVADRQMIMFRPQSYADDQIWVDVQAFEKNLSLAGEHDHAGHILCRECVSHLESAAAIYSDDFLHGFTLPDSPSFDEWQFHEAEKLRQMLARAMDNLAHWNIESGDYDRALDFARRWSNIDPLVEEAHRTLMKLYELNGQHAAALRQFEILGQILATELGIEPESESIRLYESIRQGHFKTIKSIGISSHVAPMPVHLLADTTPFIGRDRELTQGESS